jgi:hypothetical protein
VNLEYHVQNSFLLRQHLVAVFFDLDRLMTQLGVMVSLEPFTGGILDADYYCFFRTYSRIVISVSLSAMFYLSVTHKKMESHKDPY